MDTEDLKFKKAMKELEKFVKIRPLRIILQAPRRSSA